MFSALARRITQPSRIYILQTRSTWVFRRRHLAPYDKRLEYGLPVSLDNQNFLLEALIDEEHESNKYYVYDEVEKETPTEKELFWRMRKLGEMKMRRKGNLKWEDVFAALKPPPQKPLPPLSVILMRSIDGLGERGDVVEVDRWKARDILIPLRFALYASPENLQRYAKPEEVRRSQPIFTSELYKTMLHLKRMKLYIPMNPQNIWTLTPAHVRGALRRHGVIASESNIELPETIISNTSMNRPFYITLVLGSSLGPAQPSEADRESAYTESQSNLTSKLSSSAHSQPIPSSETGETKTKQDEPKESGKEKKKSKAKEKEAQAKEKEKDERASGTSSITSTSPPPSPPSGIGVARVRIRVEAQIWPIRKRDKQKKASPEEIAKTAIVRYLMRSKSDEGTPSSGPRGSPEDKEKLERQLEGEPIDKDVPQVVWHPNDVFSRPQEQSWR